MEKKKNTKKTAEVKTVKKTKTTTTKKTSAKTRKKQPAIKSISAPVETPAEKLPVTIEPDKTPSGPKKTKVTIPIIEKEVEIQEDISPDAIARGDHPMSVIEHLDEFRSRFMKVFGVFIIVTCVAFYFSDAIVYYINKPFLSTNYQLHVFKLTGGFMIRFKASAAVAILVLIPYLLFHIWRFIAPAIGKTDRTYSRLTIISAVLLFYSGVAFVFFLLIPFTIKMFLSFIGTYMITTIGADDYLNMIFIFCLIMGILFEMPVIMLVLTKLGIVTPQLLITKRKYAIVIIWIIAAVVSPPDVISQILCGIPLMFLYEVSIVVSRLMMKRKKLKELSAEK